jgi:hypothetical protein
VAERAQHQRRRAGRGAQACLCGRRAGGAGAELGARGAGVGVAHRGLLPRVLLRRRAATAPEASSPVGEQRRRQDLLPCGLGVAVVVRSSTGGGPAWTAEVAWCGRPRRARPWCGRASALAETEGADVARRRTGGRLGLIPRARARARQQATRKQARGQWCES